MEIILKEDIVNLGYKNDIVTVKSGYGRNYLIPTGKAVIASPAAKKMLAEELKQRAHKLEKIKKDAEELAAKLEGVSLKIATKVSSTGTIFGSVGNIQIAEELAKLGHNIDRKKKEHIHSGVCSLPYCQPIILLVSWQCFFHYHLAAYIFCSIQFVDCLLGFSSFGHLYEGKTF